MIKTLRKKVLARTVSIFFLIVFVQSLFPQQYLYALTIGPHQPEYTSYESPGATDMVNLSTGDFTFSLPVLEVPGPEGNFSLPLTYKAGIGLEQEASWVGLGMSLNAGSLTRVINGFPDDANGEAQTVDVKDSGVHGWDMSVFGVGSFGWNSDDGHYGSVSLLSIVNANWGRGESSVGVVGINVSGGGVTVDGGEMAMGIISIVSVGGTALAQGFATAVVKAVAVDAIVDGTLTTLSSLGGDGSPAPTNGYWKYSKKEKKIWTPWGIYKSYKIWLDQTRVEDMYGTLYLGNAPTTPNISSNGGYVDLYLKNGGVSETLNQFTKTEGTANQGAASDVNFGTSETSSYSYYNTPITLAQDYFSVNMGTISGSITPYRLEVGSVSMPREMSINHTRLAPVPYLSNTAPYSNGGYKVPFVYEGSSNAYFHHVGSATGVTSPGFYFGISTTVETSGNNKLIYELNDVTLKSQRIKSSIVSTKKIAQHHYVEWLSNEEVKTSVTYPSKYIDFLSGGAGPGVSQTSDRYLFRTAGAKPLGTSKSSSFNASSIPVSASFINYVPSGTLVDVYLSIYTNQTDWDNGDASDYAEVKNIQVTSVTNNPSAGVYTIGFTNAALAAQNGKIVDIQIKLVNDPTTPYGMGGSSSLGAFCITAVDGTTYHFGLPIYDYDQATFIRNVSDVTKNSTIRKPNPFANTWVLTAITGSDFVDRNSNGLADEGDWGHWVKLNYGVHSSKYEWAHPTIGYLRSPDNQSESFSGGKAQLVYLNSIETRSHVALFKKSSRLDARGINVPFLSPLKLDEITLLTKEHYKKLITPSAQGGYNMADFSNKIDLVLTASSLSSGAQTFIEQNALKRIQFGYAYDLCPGAINSGAEGGGKLTLKTVSVLGKNNLKAVPDYKFEYGFNPSYDQNNWDGFGMYTSGGTVDATTHDVAQLTAADQYGSAWSLSKIITPTGAEISVNYERDDYSNISGQPIMHSVSFGNSNYNVYYYPGGGDVQNGEAYNQVTLGSTSGFAVGDVVEITGTIRFKCENAPSYVTQSYSGIYTITAINGTKVTINGDFLGIGTCGIPGSAHVDYNTGSISKILSKKGGNIRVGSIVMKDEFGNQNKIRYLYKNPDGSSTGSLSKAADYTNPGVTVNTPLGYPSTPVIYGSVAVLAGKLTTDSDYYSKQVYEFETPDLQQFTVANNTLKLREHIGGAADYLTLVQWKIEDRTSKIGALKSVKLYNKNNVLYSSSVLTYTDQNTNPILNNGVNNYQGVYSSSVIQGDRARETTSPLSVYHRATRTTVLKYPHEVRQIINYKDGFKSESKNLSWDLITGAVNAKLDKSSLGIYVKTVTKPAYLEPAYSEMGPKAENINNRNMLSQVAATYVYKSDANGTNVGLIGAAAQTWKKDWSTYRYYNGADYGDDPDTSNPVWRKSSSYAWKGNYGLLRADGAHTFTTGDEFNFTTPASNTSWQFVGETQRYDHYSMALESRGYDNVYSAVKMGYDNRIVIAEATNAKFTEIAFTSAEDIVPGIPFFGGEVALGSGTVLYKRKGDFTLANTGDSNITGPHTGDAAVVVSATNAKTFIYKPTGLRTNQTYRASVWASSTNARIYYNLNGGSEQTSAAPTTAVKAGKWYQLNFEIPVATQFTSLEVGVKSASGKVVFDDFRFQPINAGMTCYVYNPLDFEFSSDFNNYTYVLDNDNFFTLFVESADGLLSKVYRESIAFGGTDGYRLISEEKTNYRRFNVNP